MAEGKGIRTPALTICFSAQFQTGFVLSHRLSHQNGRA